MVPFALRRVRTAAPACPSLLTHPPTVSFDALFVCDDFEGTGYGEARLENGGRATRARARYTQAAVAATGADLGPVRVFVAGTRRFVMAPAEGAADVGRALGEGWRECGGAVAQFRVDGPRATELLGCVLRVASASGAWEALASLRGAAGAAVPPGAILGLELLDPRPLRPAPTLGSVADGAVTGMGAALAAVAAAPWPAAAASSALWEMAASGDVREAAPVKKDDEVNQRRHERRLEELVNPMLPEGGSAEAPQVFPAALIQDERGLGWDVLVPATWARAVWADLIYAGAHSHGRDEAHAIATERRQRWFPEDHPASPAYARFSALEERRLQEQNARKPRGKREDRSGHPFAAGAPVSSATRAVFVAMTRRGNPARRAAVYGSETATEPIGFVTSGGAALTGVHSGGVAQLTVAPPEAGVWVQNVGSSERRHASVTPI